MMPDTSQTGPPAPESAPERMSPALLSTQDLLTRARAGDAPALNQLCARYLERLSRWAHGRLPAAARSLLDTNDLVQEAIVRTVQRLDRLELPNEGALQAYFRQAILNRLRDQVRAARIRSNVPEAAAALPAGGRSALESLIDNETIDRYEVALARLSAEEQLGVHLRLELDYGYARIAEVLAKPSPDAARMVVNRAISRLSQEMRREP